MLSVIVPCCVLLHWVCVFATTASFITCQNKRLPDTGPSKPIIQPFLWSLNDIVSLLDLIFWEDLPHRLQETKCSTMKTSSRFYNSSSDNPFHDASSFIVWMSPARNPKLRSVKLAERGIVKEKETCNLRPAKTGHERPRGWSKRKKS